MNLILTLWFLLGMRMNDYEILPVPELEAKLKAENRDVYEFDIQLNKSYAYVYFLKSGEVILLPNSLWDKLKGVLFKSKSVYDTYAASEHFPIENNDMALAELFQQEIMGIRNEIPVIRSYLSKLYGLDSNTVTHFDILSMAQKRIGKRKISDKEKMYTELLLGEYIRSSINGKWIILKQFGTFNPFFKPGVVNKDDNILPLDQVSHFFLTKNGMTLENFIKLPFVQEPKLKMGSAFFNLNYRGSRVVE